MSSIQLSKMFDRYDEQLDKKERELGLAQRDIAIERALVERFRRELGAPTIKSLDSGRVNPPLVPGVNQRDWILKLLEANPSGLRPSVIYDYLEQHVQSNARNRRSGVSSILAVLIRRGKVTKSDDGICRLSQDRTA